MSEKRRNVLIVEIDKETFEVFAPMLERKHFDVDRFPGAKGAMELVMLVPFEALTEMHAEQYARKGWVDLDYEVEGNAGTLRLNDYKIKAFPEIVAETCRRKGFEDPYQKWQEQKRAAEPSPE